MISTIERKSFDGSISFNTTLLMRAKINDNKRGIERGGYGYDIGPNPYQMTTTTIAVAAAASNIFPLRSI